MIGQIKTVLVAGPNGTLGKPVIAHLEAAGFDITLLTRSGESTRQKFPALKVVEADYTSVEDLTKILRSEVGPQDALLVLINRDQVEAQINVMEAAVATGTTHILPSAFGTTMTGTYARTLPIWFTKVQMEEYVDQGSKEGRFTFTGVQTGAFLDWAVKTGVFINLINPAQPTVVFDGGDVPFSATFLDDVGKAVVGALRNASQLQNRWVYVHSVVTTQNQMLDYAREAEPTREFKTMNVDSEQLEKMSWEKWNAGDRSRETIRGFMPRMFGKGLGVFHETDNATLGVEQWSEKKLKEWLANFLKGL